MRFGPREIIFLVVLLTVPVASGFYVFKPRNDQIAAARAEIQTKQAKLEQLTHVTEQLVDLELAIERGRDAIGTLEAKLPKKQNIEDIIEQIWSIARRNKLTVKSVKSEKSVAAATYMELPLKVEMEGQFDGFYQFLLELEGLDRITRIHNMKLTRTINMGAAGTVQPGAMKAAFTLSIYHEP